MGFRQDDTASGNHVTPATAVLASSVLAGSLITILVEQRNANVTHGVPSGFALDAHAWCSPAVSGWWSVKLYSKIADGSEGTSFAVTSTNSAGHVITVTEYTGYGALIPGSVQTIGASVGTNYQFSVSPAANALAVVGAIAGDDSDTAFTPVASFTERQDTNLGVVGGGGSAGPQMAYGDRELTPGTYTVGFNASGGGLERGAVVALYAEAAPPDPPVAEFSASPLLGPSGTVVDFEDESTNDPDEWDWDFGDGDTSTSQHPSHAYAPGVWTVTLTVTNAGGSDSETKISYIVIYPEPLGHAILIDIFDVSTGVPVYEGTVTDAMDRKFQVQKNGDGTIEFTLNRNSVNAGFVQADRFVKIRIPQIHSGHIFAGFIEAPTVTVISDNEKGGETLNVVGRGALSYWANAIWLSDAFVLPWWTCDDDPPSDAKGQVNVKANGGPQAGNKYRFYTVAGGVITGYSDETVGSDSCWYFKARQTYQWPSQNSKRFLVLLLDGPHAGDYFHPHQDGVTETLKSVSVGDTIALGAISDAPGAVIKHMYDAAQEGSRPINPLALMTVDFDDTDDSDGNPWDTTDALASMTVPVHEDYLETIAKLLATGVVDVEMGPDLDMHAWNAPHGRDLTGASYGAGVVRFVRGPGDGSGNIADKLDRQARDARVATFSEVAGTDNTFVPVELPDASGRVPREVGIRGDTNVATALEALGLADLNARLEHNEAVGFNVKLPRVGVSPDEDVGLYLPGPDFSDNGSYWVGDIVTVHTGDDAHDFEEVDATVAAITLSEDDGGNLQCLVEVGTGLGRPGPGRYGSGLARSPGSVGAQGSFVTRSSETTPEGSVEVGNPVEVVGEHTGDASGAHAASAITFTPAGSIAASNVQGATEEVATDAAAATAVVAGALVAHAAEILTHETAEMDDTLVLKPDGAGGLEFGPGGGGAITVDETDGSPSVADVTTIRFPSGTVTDLTGGVVSVRDAPKAFIGVRNTTGSVTLVNGSYVYPAFAGADDFDTDGFHDTVTNNSRFTVPAGLGGKYLLVIQGNWPSTGNVDRRIAYRVNGGSDIMLEREYYNNPGVSLSKNGVIAVDLAAGDYVQVGIYTSAGAGTGGAYLSMVKLDSGKVGQGIGAKAYRTTTQTIATGDAFVEVSFDAEEFDTDGFHDNSTNPTRFTIPAGLGGKYLLAAGGAWDTSAAGAQRVGVFQKNGSVIVGTEIGQVPSAATALGTINTTVVDLVAGDYVEHAVYQDSGGNRSYGGTTGSKSAWMSIMRLDSGSANVLAYSQVVRNNVSNLTTTSATWADVDGTNLTTTMATGPRRVRLRLSGRLTCNTVSKLLMFGWMVDGVAVKTESAGAAPLLGGNMVQSLATTGISLPFDIEYITDVLTAGSHTFKPRWAENGAGGELWTLAIGANDYCILTAEELQF